LVLKSSLPRYNTTLRFNEFLHTAVSDNQAFFRNFQHDLKLLAYILEHEPSYPYDFHFLVDTQGHAHLFDFDSVGGHVKNMTGIFARFLQQAESAAREQLANNTSIA
jgi:hypothetical protein